MFALKKILLIGLSMLLLAGCSSTAEEQTVTKDETTYNYKGQRVVNPFKNDIIISHSSSVTSAEGGYHVIKETKKLQTTKNKEALEKVHYESIPKSNLNPDRSKVIFNYKVVAEGTIPSKTAIAKNKVYYIHNADVFKTLEMDFGFEQPNPPFSPLRDYYLVTFSNTCDFNVGKVSLSSNTTLNITTNGNKSSSCNGERKFAIIETPEVAAKTYSINGYSGKVIELASDFLNSLK